MWNICIISVLSLFLVGSTLGQSAEQILSSNLNLGSQPTAQSRKITTDGLGGKVVSSIRTAQPTAQDRVLLSRIDSGLSRSNSGSVSHRRVLVSSPSDDSNLNLGTLNRASQSFLLGASSTRSPQTVFKSAPVVQRTCPYRNPRCDRSSPYRTADGSCNNLFIPNFGRAKTPFTRIQRARYDDGIQAPRRRFFASAGHAPSARTVSRTVIPTTSDFSRINNHILMGWGQFMDHDFTLTPEVEGEEGRNRPQCCAQDAANFNFRGRATPEQTRQIQSLLARRPECFPIPVENDPIFRTKCINFVRSAAAPNIFCTRDVRQQIDDLTHWIDASNVYGSSQRRQNELRTFRGGLMKSQIRRGEEILPADPGNPRQCTRSNADDCDFEAGDSRSNEQAGLSSVHSLLLRAHNKIARQLSAINRHWNDEKIFQTTRKIVGAMLQHITYNEFLPVILGRGLMRRYGLRLQRRGYFNAYFRFIDPSIVNVFGAAAFRFGHSLVRQKFSLSRSPNSNYDSKDISEMFRAVNFVYNNGVDGLLVGQVHDRAEKFDNMCVHGLRNRLFNDELDLMAFNIQRGRDHGLASYNDYRRAFRLPIARNFNALRRTHHGDDIRALNSVYPSVEDLEVWPAGVAEKPVRGGVVGPLFGNIIAFQFFKLRYGDRFWYESGDPTVRFTPGQLRELRRVTLAMLYCENISSLRSAPRRLFQRASRFNPLVSCNKIPKMNLNEWREVRTG